MIQVLSNIIWHLKNRGIINMSKVTVFMPVYNAGKYLKDSIGSILNQTYKDFELLIIDNCSTDNSVSIVESYKDSRIHLVVNNENIGLAASRNKALEICDSEYIALLDADDIAMPYRLQREIEYLDIHKNIAVVGGYAEVIDEYGFGKDMLRPQLVNYNYIRAYMVFNDAVANSSAMVRKSVLDNNNIRYADNCYGVEDYKFWCEVIKYGDIANMGEILLKYRVTPGSITADANSYRLNERKRIIKEIQKNNIDFYGFKFPDEELHVLLDVFEEDGTVDSIDNIKLLYGALKSMASQAYKKELGFAKETAVMCRKRFGEKVGKAMFLWEEGQLL